MVDFKNILSCLAKYQFDIAVPDSSIVEGIQKEWPFLILK
jgi:hypothetical protein